MKTYLKDSLTDLAYLVIAVYAGFILMLALNIPLKFLFDGLTLTASMVIVGIGTGMVYLFIKYKSIGFSSQDSDILRFAAKDMVPVFLAMAVYMILNYILEYPWAAVTTINLAQLLTGKLLADRGWLLEHPLYLILADGITMLLYLAAILTGRRIGAKKRIAERAALTKQS